MPAAILCDFGSFACKLQPSSSSHCTPLLWLGNVASVFGVCSARCNLLCTNLCSMHLVLSKLKTQTHGVGRRKWRGGKNWSLCILGRPCKNTMHVSSFHNICLLSRGTLKSLQVTPSTRVMKLLIVRASKRS